MNGCCKRRVKLMDGTTLKRNEATNLQSSVVQHRFQHRSSLNVINIWNSPPHDLAILEDVPFELRLRMWILHDGALPQFHVFIF